MVTPAGGDGRLSFRTYLVLKASAYARRRYQPAWAALFVGVEAVASTAMEHPEWDMDERRTWEEWEASQRK